MANGYSGQIQERIGAAAEGTVFINSDFADIADTETIRRNLNRLTQAGTLRRILKGVYEKPEYSEMLKEYAAFRSGLSRYLESVYPLPLTFATGAATIKAFGSIDSAQSRSRGYCFA